MSSLQQTAKAIGIFLLATLSVVALVTVLVVALDFVLLIFLGILFSIFLSKTSQLANRFLPIGYGWNLALVTLLLLLLTTGGLALLGDKIHDRSHSFYYPRIGCQCWTSFFCRHLHRRQSCTLPRWLCETVSNDSSRAGDRHTRPNGQHHV